MATIERGIGLVQRVIEELSKRPEGAGVVGASSSALDALESKLMVELPPTLRTFLAYDFTFASFGKRFKGRHRFGTDPRAPQPKMSSVRKLAEAMVELGWTDSRIRGKVVRLPNKPGQPWNALYLGEARRDGELVILGLENDETNVRVFPRYTAFDLYLAHQLGVLKLRQSAMLDDLDSHLAHNPELVSREEDEDESTDY
ncbi:SMI1/KNR4 family protein [Polyangium jinanense]|uniref:SMI1/KNR4 family protein n=1 Tax=Polyangium jinanense TaxID=2829994 RepID=A0A9X3X741_9BACT|nr:SMI1/KNR4 family protein [Polyangium jinanense]MDC3959453.1 SMI1/KNR4 family protein [Polyangium jinanense]MDC3984887.1 SMI1/KNR4 family protein [Polyangium jinanense]